MDLRNKVVVVRSTLTPEEEKYPSFSADDISILFGDIATPTGFVLNRRDPRECYVVFTDPGYIPEILKLLDDPKWVGKHMHLTLERPRKEILPIVAKLLVGQPLDKGEDFEYFPVEHELEGAEGPPTSTSRKGEDPVIPELVKHFKSLQTSELKQLMAALTREMDARHVPRDIPSKPNGLGSTPQDVSSILHSLIKEGALRTNIPKLSIFSGERVKGRPHLCNGHMNYSPSGGLTVSLP